MYLRRVHNFALGIVSELKRAFTIPDEIPIQPDALRTALHEWITIARCQAVTPRPNSVVLLGDRHGWRPLPDEIAAAEFETLRPHLLPELAKRWYRLDEGR